MIATSENVAETIGAKTPAIWVVRSTLLWNHRRQLARVTAIALVIGLVIAFAIPKQYESSTRIMPPDQQNSSAMVLAALASRGGGLGGLGTLAGGLLSGRTTTALFVDLLRSGTIGGHLIDQFHLQEVYHKRYRIDTAKRLARNTAVSDDKKSGVITITVQDTDPVRARDLAQGYLDGLNSLVTQTTTSTAHRERIFIERRLGSVEKDLEHAQLELSEFSSKNSTIDIKEQTRAMVEAAAKLQAEVLVEQAGLDSVRQIYGDDNLRVRQARSRIASLQADLIKMSGSSAPLGAGAGNGPNLTADELYPPLRQLPRLAVPFADLYRRVRVQETVYELLTQQYEMARIEEAKDTPVVSVIDPPGIPEKKSFPPRLVLALILTGLALAGASTFLLLRESWGRVGSDDLRKILANDVLANLRSTLRRVRRFRVRDQLTNAICGVLDYAAYPIGMLLVAPIILHKLGSAEYGLWVFATALVSSGSIIASGFGDANIQRIAVLRSTASKDAIGIVVRSMVGINLLVGVLLTLVGWLIAPSAARHVAASTNLQQECLLSLRIASLLMTVRALESVSISTLRAYERFGAAVGISVLARLMTLGAAVLLAYHGHGTASIMEATAVLLVLGTSAQFFQLRRFLGVGSLWPQFDRDAVMSLFDFGIYSWIQAVAGVIFGQIDRLLLGVSFGASAVASYALCVQMAQPIYGLAAAGLHFLFPYIAGRTISSSTAELRRVIRNAFIFNLLFVTASGGLLLVFGDRALRAWAGDAIAQSAAPIFPLIVFGSALLGLSVTGVYAMLALGLVRSVAWFSIAGGGLMLLMMDWSVHRSGIRGFAMARFWYGVLALLLYLPLLRRLSKHSSVTKISSAVTLSGLEEITPQ